MLRLMWMDDIGEELMLDGWVLSLDPAFRAMFDKLLANTTRLLDKEILLGLELPDLHHDIIHNVLSNTTPGYWFLMDQRNKFHHHFDFLIRAMLDLSRTGRKFCYLEHSNASGVVWNMSGVRAWLKIVDTCLGNLFALLHYGSGQPGRGSKLSILCWLNTHLHLRNFFWFGNILNVITLYNKTQTNTKSQRLISCSLEPCVGQLFIKWGTLAVPALICLAASLRAPAVEEATCFCMLVFTSLTREWDSDDLSSILSSISGEPIADGGLRHPMGLADTWHFLIDLMWRHLHNFRQLRLLHHKLITGCLSLDEINCPLPVVLSSTTLRPRIQPEDIPQLAQEVASYIIPSLDVSLAPHIQTNIAKAFATIAPIRATQSVASNDQSTSMEAGMEIIKVDIVVVQPERYEELYRVLGPTAMFLSKEQAAAVELTAERRHNFFFVLGTGGSKSLVFMAPAVNAEETKRGLVTIVVIPLKALL
jgi:hypothetical protein